MAEALYRKYRPQVFEDVVGQEPIERTLKNAISQDKVSHAYLFTGSRGTGKTTTARLLAKALLCENGPTPDPDGACEDCRLVAEGVHPDVYELDAASRTGVENVREEIISRVHFAPTRGRYKVYIIDEVHMLSQAAFNALLKTLEEPPSHVVFILCTTDPQKVPETIHSRCQRFDFHRISPESMVARLGAICISEDVEFEGEALDLIAQRADGGLRNALTSLEQIIAFENGKVTLAGAERLLGSIDSSDLVEIMTYVGKRDIANCFRWTAEYVETGADLAQFVRDMAEHVRDLYVLALVGDDAALEVSETCRRQLASELAWFGPDRAARLLGVLGDLMAELRTTSNPRLAFEVSLTRMVRPDSDLTLEGLAERVEALESGYSAVAHVLPGEPLVGESGTSDSAGEGSSRARVESPALATEAPGALRGDSPKAREEPSPAESARSGWESGFSAVGEEGGLAAGETASSGLAAERAGLVDQADSPRTGGSKMAGLSNPAALQRIWQAAMADVKRQKQAYGVLFMNTKVRFDDAAGALVVAFPAESTFAFNAVQKPDVQDALAEALARAVGEAVPFRFDKGLGQEAAAVASGGPAFVPDRMPGDQSTQRVAADQPASTRQPVPAEGRVSAESPVQDAHQAAAGQSAPAERSAPVEQQVAVEQPAPAGQAAPDDYAPYDDVPYEQVPYEEFDAAPTSVSDANTGASPAEPNLAPDGAIEEDTAALQAMLQASFGEGVVLSEADE